MHIHQGAYRYLKKKEKKKRKLPKKKKRKKRSTDHPRATIFVFEFRHYLPRFSHFLQVSRADSRANIVARGRRRKEFKEKYVEQITKEEISGLKSDEMTTTIRERILKR